MKKTVLIVIISIIALIIILVCGGLIWYNTSLSPVNGSSEEKKVIEISEGTRTEEILNILVENNLIKSKLVAGLYIKLNGVKSLQAGKYQISPSMSLKDILNKISSGDVYNEEVKITFVEGKNIRWYAKTIAEKTNNTEEDVYKLLEDKEYIDSLINKYWFLNDTIQDENIYYPLEGYLYPDTYIFENADVSVKTIFNIILNKTDKVLTEYKTAGAESGLSVHQLMTIASIVELEGNDKEARAGIASVIFNRLKSKMSLGSDVTTYYAFKIDMGERNLTTDEINTYNAYNTRGPNMSGKLPVGPICNPSKEAIEAVLEHKQTNYLYFVADSNGKIYFTTTYQEHKQKIQELQKQGLWYQY